MKPFTETIGTTSIDWHIRLLTVDGQTYAIPLMALRTNGNAEGFVTSRLIYCPKCGDVWARDGISRHPARPAPHQWTARAALCERCGGGFLLDEENLSRDDLPYDLLVREFLLHTNDRKEPLPC